MTNIQFTKRVDFFEAFGMEAAQAGGVLDVAVLLHDGKPMIGLPEAGGANRDAYEATAAAGIWPPSASK